MTHRVLAGYLAKSDPIFRFTRDAIHYCEKIAKISKEYPTDVELLDRIRKLYGVNWAYQLILALDSGKIRAELERAE